MLKTLRADETEPKIDDEFEIRRTKPGTLLDNDGDDTAFGPLAFVDHATLGTGTVVSMHEHRDDEILSYLWRGSMVHEDSTGDTVTIHPGKLMMMNSGSGFEHEESVPDGSVEMLQIFIRPSEAGLEPSVAFHDRPEREANRWTLIAGPSGEDAPLAINQRVWFQDIRLEAGRGVAVPSRPGTIQWLYVMDGEIGVGEDLTLNTRDGVTDPDAPLPAIMATRDTDAVLFHVERGATQTREGKFSGT